jgi:hypothetical protein
MFINYAGREVWLSEDMARQVGEAIDRYIGRHGDIQNPALLPRHDREDMRQTIMADWMGADWLALSWTHLANTGRTLFPADGEPMAYHLKAALFMAGRARVRRWHGEDEGTTIPSLRSRGSTDFSGAGMGSRTASPDQILGAIESAQKDGLRAVSERARASRKRQVRTRRSFSYIINVVARYDDRTAIQIEKVAQHNYRTAGSVANRETPKSRKRLPKGTGKASMREALEG